MEENVQNGRPSPLSSLGIFSTSYSVTIIIFGCPLFSLFYPSHEVLLVLEKGFYHVNWRKLYLQAIGIWSSTTQRLVGHCSRVSSIGMEGISSYPLPSLFFPVLHCSSSFGCRTSNHIPMSLRNGRNRRPYILQSHSWAISSECSDTRSDI